MLTAVTSSKCCLKCGCDKPRLEFNRSSRQSDGLQTWCRDCSKGYYRQNSSKWKSFPSQVPETKSAYNAAYYAERKDLELDRCAAYHEANRDRRLEQSKQWRSDNRPRMRYLFAKRRAAQLLATPSWADQDSIGGMYELADIFKRAGLQIEVDHIVPLQGKTVCGLHCESNLQLLNSQENKRKGNKLFSEVLQC